MVFSKWTEYGCHENLEKQSLCICSQEPDFIVKPTNSDNIIVKAKDQRVKRTKFQIKWSIFSYAIEFFLIELTEV